MSGCFRFPQAVGDGRVRDAPVLNLHSALSECGECPSAYQAGEIVSSSARPGRHFDRDGQAIRNYGTVYVLVIMSCEADLSVMGALSFYRVFV